MKVLLMFGYLGANFADIVIVRNIIILQMAIFQTLSNQYQQFRKNKKSSQSSQQYNQRDSLKHITDPINNQLSADKQQDNNSQIFKQSYDDGKQHNLQDDTNTDIDNTMMNLKSYSMQTQHKFIDQKCEISQQNKFLISNQLDNKFTEDSQNYTNMFLSLVVYNTLNPQFTQKSEFISQINNDFQIDTISFYQQKKIYELALLSFTAQIYGARGTVKILRSFKQPESFDVVQQVKEQILGIGNYKYHKELKSRVKRVSPLKKKIMNIDDFEAQNELLGSRSDSRNVSLMDPSFQSFIDKPLKLEQILEKDAELEATKKYLQLPDINIKRNLINIFEIDEENNEGFQMLDDNDQIVFDGSLNFEQDPKCKTQIPRIQEILNDNQDNDLKPFNGYSTVYLNEIDKINQPIDHSSPLLPQIQYPEQLLNNPIQEILIDSDRLQLSEDNQSNKSQIQEQEYADILRQKNIKIPQSSDFVLRDHLAQMGFDSQDFSKTQDAQSNLHEEEQAAQEIQIGRKRKRGDKKKLSKRSNNMEDKENQQSKFKKNQNSGQMVGNSIGQRSSIFGFDSIVQIDSFDTQSRADGSQQRLKEIDQNIQPEVIQIESKQLQQRNASNKKKRVQISVYEDFQDTQTLKPKQETNLESYQHDGLNSTLNMFDPNQPNQEDNLMLQTFKSFNNMNFYGSDENSNLGRNQSELDQRNDTNLSQLTDNNLHSNRLQNLQTKATTDQTQPTLEIEQLELNQQEDPKIPIDSNPQQKNCELILIKDKLNKRAISSNVNDIQARLFKSQHINRATCQKEGTIKKQSQFRNHSSNNETILIGGPIERLAQNKKPPLAKQNTKKQINLDSEKSDQVGLRQNQVQQDKIENRRQNPNVISISSDNQNMQLITSSCDDEHSHRQSMNTQNQINFSRVDQDSCEEQQTRYNSITERESKNERKFKMKNLIESKTSRLHKRDIKEVVDDLENQPNPQYVQNQPINFYQKKDKSNHNSSFNSINQQLLNQSQTSAYMQAAETQDTVFILQGRRRSDQSQQQQKQQRGRVNQNYQEKLFDEEQDRMNRAANQALNLSQNGSEERMQTHRQKLQENRLQNIIKIQKDEKSAPLIAKQLQSKAYLKYSGLSQINKAYHIEKQIQSQGDSNKNINSSRLLDRDNSFDSQNKSNQQQCQDFYKQQQVLNATDNYQMMMMPQQQQQQQLYSQRNEDQAKQINSYRGSQQHTQQQVFENNISFRSNN
eukprot:403375887